MTPSQLNQARRALFLANRILGDINAVKRGRIGQRVTNRVLGRVASGLMRELWR